MFIDCSNKYTLIWSDIKLIFLTPKVVRSQNCVKALRTAYFLQVLLAAMVTTILRNTIWCDRHD